MRKIILTLLAMVLALPMLAFAQNGMMQKEQQQDQKNMQSDENQAAAVSENGGTTMPKHDMKGMVSNAGKSFTSDNTTYVVENPKKLKDYDNQNVTASFLFDTDNNSIHILSVTPAQ